MCWQTHASEPPWTDVSPVPKCIVLSDAAGLPLVVGVSAANTHDSLGLKPMVAGLQTRHDPENGRHYQPRTLTAQDTV